MVVDASGREKALESGSKVACIVTQVLYHDQLRLLQKSPEWCVLVFSEAFSHYFWILIFCWSGNSMFERIHVFIFFH